MKIRNIPAYILLSAAAFPVCLLLWIMITGTFMPVDELKASIGSVFFGGDEKMSVWPIMPSYPTAQPIIELLLDSPQFFVMFWNSADLVFFSVLGQFLIAAPAAWALSRFRFPGRRIVNTVYISLMLLPFQVTMVPNYLMIDFLGLMDSSLAVILPFAFSAFPVFIMIKGFDAVPAAVLEAAKVDGAGYIVIFIRIGLPLGMPGIMSALVLGFLECWNAVEQPLLFLKSESKWPLSLYLPRIVTEKIAAAMAASLLSLLPAVLVFLFGQKYLVLGIQSAGVKE